MPFVIVVLSPPGITSPSSPSRCEGRRTSTGSQPSAERERPCASNPPCTANTPIRGCASAIAPLAVCGGFGSSLPATVLEEFSLVQLLDVEPRHRLAQRLRGGCDRLRVAEVGRRLDDRAGAGR